MPTLLTPSDPAIPLWPRSASASASSPRRSPAERLFGFARAVAGCDMSALGLFPVSFRSVGSALSWQWVGTRRSQVSCPVCLPDCCERFGVTLLSLFPGFVERLQQDIRQLAPSDFEVPRRQPQNLDSAQREPCLFEAGMSGVVGAWLCDLWHGCVGVCCCTAAAGGSERVEGRHAAGQLWSAGSVLGDVRARIHTETFASELRICSAAQSFVDGVVVLGWSSKQEYEEKGHVLCRQKLKEVETCLHVR